MDAKLSPHLAGGVVRNLPTGYGKARSRSMTSVCRIGCGGGNARAVAEPGRLDLGA
jgi:hypothetical protein